MRAVTPAQPPRGVLVETARFDGPCFLHNCLMGGSGQSQSRVRAGNESAGRR
jgi:hypothetical protein